MRDEVGSAVAFLAKLLGNGKRVSQDQIDNFHQTLYTNLCTHYQNHWFPEKPFKGSGFRCIRINHNMDPLIVKAAAGCGVSETELMNSLPKEMTIWVDPKEVSYRFGEDGSIGVIFDESMSRSSSSSSVSESDSSDCEIHSSHQQPMGHQQMQTPFVSEQHKTQDFLRACTEQLRYCFADNPMENVNLEYLASTFVAS